MLRTRERCHRTEKRLEHSVPASRPLGQAELCLEFGLQAYLIVLVAGFRG